MKNESAFPQADFVRTGNEGTPAIGGLNGGLTKRELLSAMALQGLISTLTINRDEHAELLSQTAVKYADALIAELERKEE